MRNKVLIFGVCGFVGRYLADELQRNGYEVVGSDTLPTPTFDIPYHQADILDSEAVNRLVIEVNPYAIINLAAISSVGMSWSQPAITMKVNVVGPINILEAARKLENIPKILFIGSSEEYEQCEEPLDEGMPINANNPYGISKMTQERISSLYRDRYNMKIYCVRAFNHTGEGQKDTFVLPSWCKQVAEITKTGKEGCLEVGNIDVTRDFSDVRDIVRAYRMVLESDKYDKVFNIGSGKSYKLRELLEYVVGLSDRNIEIRVRTELIRPTDTPSITCNHDLITKELGWEPERDIRDTLKELYEYYLRQ